MTGHRWNGPYSFDGTERKCQICKEWFLVAELTSMGRRCKPCAAAQMRKYREEGRLGQNKPIAHSGAYTVVIRNRYDGKLFKWTGDIPSGYDVTYTAPLGSVLPRKFWLLEVYCGEVK